MFGDLLEGFRIFLCLVLAGAAIKWVDDYLDAEYDICRGKHTLAVRMSRSALPYGMVLAFLAAAAQLPMALSVFFGSYAVGMLSDWKQVLPTKLPAWLETVMAVALSLVLTGWRTALWGLLLMAMFDWLDDLVDRLADQRTGQHNIALRLGVVEATLLTMLALCGAILLNAWWTAIAFLAFTVITMWSEATTRSLWSASGEDDKEVPWG
ncbi:hypothetical protein GCM10025857_02350 [Alicyclobacillus contaminans]|uniref:hypothetical protein n=1 Tax=Alicyclobacillus contaminans TaxID=392016 RepID=UPI00042140E5|nr:hypothetical protein [Alicyclobacillus contaminans]GMA48878.1 hypothetical protein GCM10025857_02350 [Alicyclobacillus contaminans]